MTSNKNKYFSDPHLINAAINAVKFMEKRSEEDVFFRNSIIEEEFRKVVVSLSDAVIETGAETKENSVDYWDEIDRQERIDRMNNVVKPKVTEVFGAK